MEKMVLLNDFETMCKRLYKCKQGCKSNPYLCAEEAVKEYIGSDRNRLLRLKAEAEGGDFYSYSTSVFALAALFISFMNAIDITYIEPICGIPIKVLIWALLGVVTVLLIIMVYKFWAVLKWRKYILVAISEIEKKKERKKRCFKSCTR